MLIPKLPMISTEAPGSGIPLESYTKTVMPDPAERLTHFVLVGSAAYPVLHPQVHRPPFWAYPQVVLESPPATNSVYGRLTIPSPEGSCPVQYFGSWPGAVPPDVQAAGPEGPEVPAEGGFPEVPDVQAAALDTAERSAASSFPIASPSL